MSLQSLTPGQVSFSHDAVFQLEKSQFWSVQQSETSPACFFRPSTAQDVASAVKISRRTQCPFAAKSGGHAAFAGASNIAGGITIDFSALNNITVSADKRTVSVGPGNTWLDVYSRLQSHDLVTIGGRVAAIGVGGLTLGGGISFFSNLYGWALDNVSSYEVVTAAGEIITASHDRNQDLYWALRGGGNNFGLVTQFELYSYPLKGGLMWGGSLVHPGAHNASLLQAMVEYGSKGAIADPKSALIFNIGYVQASDEFVCVSDVEYAAPLPNGTHPAVFDRFFDEPGRLQDTAAQKTLADLTLELNSSNPSGFRESYWTATVGLDVTLMQDLLSLWVEVVEPIKNITGFLPFYSLELVSIPVLKMMGRNGGNALGLDAKAPLVVINPGAMWAQAADDDAVLGAYATWLAKAKIKAEARGLWHPYVYMNYASFVQDPIASYGDRNVARLKEIARKYDPEGVFQRLQPGYFKL